MAELWLRDVGETSTKTVTSLHPLPVKVTEQPAAQSHDTGLFVVPGVGAGVAYTSGDAMGTKFSFLVPNSGHITVVYGVDLDKEALAFDLLLFVDDFTATADNVAMDLADADGVKFVGHLSVAAGNYASLNDNAVFTTRVDPPLHYVTQNGRLYCQLVTRGVPNYTTAQDLSVGLRVLPD